MITHDDLLRWASAGLAPERLPPPPEPPNFRGDVVKFTQRDDAGAIIGSGHMHRHQIAEHQARGENLQIEDDDHPGLPVETPSGFRPIGALEALLAAIKRQLVETDHFFLPDRDSVTDQEREAWAKYRRALRSALKASTIDGALSEIPTPPPKGSDPFDAFRGPKVPAGGVATHTKGI